MSAKRVRDIRDLLDRQLDRHQQDAEDRRCLRGKYAPPKGVCRVCGDVVGAMVDFPHTDMIGGSPMNAYIERWECLGCGLVYGKCPPPVEETSGKVL